MKRAVFYARVSSDLQQKEGTIESQVAELKRQIRKAGHTLVKEYIDDGYSGAQLDRPALEKLRADVKADIFDAIYFQCADRIAREVIHQNIIIGEILKYKKQIIINGEDYEHNPENKFTLTVLGAVAELERAKLIERVMRGRQYRLEQGYLLGNGHNTFGYRYIKKTDSSFPSYVINKEEAKIVRYIFETYAKGEMGVRPLVRDLKNKGLVGRNKLNQSQIKFILHNEMYTGIRYFNTMKEEKSQDPMFKNGSGKIVYTDRTEWIGIKVPAIISHDLFYKTQKRLDHNKKCYRNATKPQMLSNLVICGTCGSNCFTYRRNYLVKRKGKEQLYQRAVYKCNKKKGRCKNKEIDSRVLESSVFAMIKETLLKREKLSNCLELSKKQDSINKPKIKRELLGLNNKMGKINKKRQRVIDLYATGDLARQDYIARIRTYDTELEALKEKQSALDNSVLLLKKPEIIQASISSFCEKASKKLNQCSDFKTKRKFILEYIKQVEYMNEKTSDTIKLRGVLPVKIKKKGFKAPYCVELKIDRAKTLEDIKEKDMKDGVSGKTRISQMLYGELITKHI